MRLVLDSPFYTDVIPSKIAAQHLNKIWQLFVRGGKKMMRRKQMVLYYFNAPTVTLLLLFFSLGT